jgi:hypothetical protein
MVCDAMHLGSEIYQETLVKALAKHFGARLLVVDSLLLPGVSSSYSLRSDNIVATWRNIIGTEGLCYWYLLLLKDKLCIFFLLLK